MDVAPQLLVHGGALQGLRFEGETEDGDEVVDGGSELVERSFLERGFELVADDEPAFALQHTCLGLLFLFGAGRGFVFVALLLFRQEVAKGEFAIFKDKHLLGSLFRGHGEALVPVLPLALVMGALDCYGFAGDDWDLLAFVAESGVFRVDVELAACQETGGIQAASAVFFLREVEESLLLGGVAGAAWAAAVHEGAGIIKPLGVRQRGEVGREAGFQVLARSGVPDAVGEILIRVWQVGYRGEEFHHLRAEVVQLSLWSPCFQEILRQGGELVAAGCPLLRFAERGGEVLYPLLAAIDETLEEECLGVGIGVEALKVLGEDSLLKGVVIVFPHDGFECLHFRCHGGGVAACASGDLVVPFLLGVWPDEDRGFLFRLQGLCQFLDRGFRRLGLPCVLRADVEFCQRDELDLFCCCHWVCLVLGWYEKARCEAGFGDWL